LTPPPRGEFVNVISTHSQSAQAEGLARGWWFASQDQMTAFYYGISVITQNAGVF